jgi:hypothetical protein
LELLSTGRLTFISSTTKTTPLYLGGEDEVRQARSRDALKGIKSQAEHLAPKELAEAIELLRGRAT